MAFCANVRLFLISTIIIEHIHLEVNETFIRKPGRNDLKKKDKKLLLSSSKTFIVSKVAVEKKHFQYLVFMQNLTTVKFFCVLCRRNRIPLARPVSSMFKKSPTRGGYPQPIRVANFQEEYQARR
jgi:hypothetical protein